MKARIAIALVLVLAITAGCAGTPTGAKIDDQCIAGRLRSESAQWLVDNPGAWKRHKDFKATLAKGDRILSRHCSEALIALSAGDLKALAEALRKIRQNDD